MACVVFALFGAPLAIITIGDLGKFLSECTIWLYKQIIDTRKRIGIWWNRLRLRGSSKLDDMESGHGSLDKSNVDWGEIDRTGMSGCLEKMFICNITKFPMTLLILKTFVSIKI